MNPIIISIEVKAGEAVEIPNAKIFSTFPDNRPGHEGGAIVLALNTEAPTIQKAQIVGMDGKSPVK